MPYSAHIIYTALSTLYPRARQPDCMFAIELLYENNHLTIKTWMCLGLWILVYTRGFIGKILPCKLIYSCFDKPLCYFFFSLHGKQQF